MRIISTFTNRTESLIPDTPEQQRQAQRDRQTTELHRAIINNKTEIPRKRLQFGRYFIEDTDTRDFFKPFGGDPSYGPDVRFYYVREDGVPVMLEPADPPNRTEMERRQAAKAQRRQEKAEAAKAHYQRLRASK